MNVFEEQKKYEEAIQIMNQDPCKDILQHITSDILQQKNSAMAMEFARIICDLLKQNGVYIHCTETKLNENITYNSIEEKYGIVFDSVDFSQHDKEFLDEIGRLKEELRKSQNTINQIDEIMRELFNVTFEICETKEDFDGFKKYLKKNIETSNVSDFIPTEPIKVTDMLIDNAMKSYDDYVREFVKSNSGNLVDANPFGDVMRKSISYLREIAEHLLIYCNARD